MSCFGCSKKYGLFCKEHGCPNCGYSYCAKCLNRPMAVPRHNGKVLNVCLICFDKLSKLQPSEKVIDCDALPGTIVTKTSSKSAKLAENSAIDNLLEIEAPTNLGDILEPINANTKISAAANIHSNDSENAEIADNLDCMITKRLKNLKTVDNLPNDDELRSRLANLNGMPLKDYSKKDILLSTDVRTDAEKMNDLLAQFMGEAHLDQRLDTERNDSISDIEKRLRALRDTPLENVGGSKKSYSPDTNTPSDNEQDNETTIRNIVQKYLAEARLPTPLENELNSSIPAPPIGTKPTDLEELPWCNICNEDAIWRCKGCDGELFCEQCFRECHNDDEEYRAHVKERYTAPPKFKENHF